MLDIPGYSIKEKLSQGKKFTIYRGLRVADNQNAILKVCRVEQPSIQELAALKHEYQLLKQLKLPQIIKVYGLIKHQHQLVLVLEDINGYSLSKYLSTNKLSLDNFFKIALQITEALHTLHLQHIIHKDINPNNIAIEPQQLTIKLIDFSISSQLSQETLALTPEHLEGTLAYLSPEQTGRMNCLVDYRADFYSLGVTFYEMLTGRLPFDTPDPLELIYSHLTKAATPVNELDATIPKMLADIVAKLMAKLPEGRYASAAGLKVDLLECQRQWQLSHTIKPFALGGQDFSHDLIISQKLYGRETQVQQLLEAFDRTSQGQCELFLVAGYSGIGKTSLVKEIYKPITHQRGYFISGKFDQLQRTTPYSAIIEALQDLVRRLLAEPPERLEQLKINLLAALGANGQVIIDVLPTMALIIGEQPPVVELPAEQAQHRFLLTFQAFIRTLAQPQHPLVLFLDDLQWIDGASLQLINQLAADTKLKYFLLIGAYRDNEVSVEHPLIMSLELLAKSNITINTINLCPLAQTDIIDMLADSFNCPHKRVESLVQLLLNKTEGNPFFINEFLKTLYQKQLLKFVYDRQEWQWDIKHIEEQAITDNVVELLLGRMRELPESAQKVLSLAACIGHNFNLHTLSLISENTLAATAHQLWVAAQSYFIKPLGDSYQLAQTLEEENHEENTSELVSWSQKIEYRFIHDRIQQAAYRLIPETTKYETHLRIGRLLLSEKSLDENDDRLFEILNHFNNSLMLINDSTERLQLAHYNLWAGRKAKLSNAYQAAVSYLTAGISLLPEDPWKTHYELTFGIYKVLAESCYLLTDRESAERYVDLLLKNVKSAVEAAEVYIIKIIMLGTVNELDDALKLGVTALRAVGLKLPAKTRLYHILFAIIKMKWVLRGRDIATLELPKGTNPNNLMVDNLMVHIGNITYMLDQNLLALIVVKATTINIKYGYTPNAPFVFLGAALISLHHLNFYNEGFAFATLGERIANILGKATATARLQYVLGCYIMHYKYPVDKSLEYITYGYQVALETGDILYAFYNIGQLALIKLTIGKPLSEAQQVVQAAWLFKIKNKLPEFDALWNMLRDITDWLQGTKPEFILPFDEFQRSLVNLQNKTETSYCYFFYGSSCFLLGNYAAALQAFEENEKYIIFILGSINYPQNQFLHAMSLIACYPKASWHNQKRYMIKLRILLRQLKRWAKWCPSNFEQYILLVSAEVARIQHKTLTAIDLYDKAIQAAHRSECLNLIAIANEATARFYLELQKPQLAKTYMQAAHYTYTQWGALIKCKLLENDFPDWLYPVEYKINPTSTTTKLSQSTSTDTPLAAIDVLSILKSAQAISSEIQLDLLLQKLLCILLENASAQRGMLLMKENNVWFVKAEGTMAAQQITLTQTERVEDRIDIPLSLIQYVQRSQEHILIQNPEDFNRYYAYDAYLEEVKPKSVLVLPVLYQNELACLFYLENREISCAFTAENIQTLRLLATQAAISLENAQLYYQATHDALTGLANRNHLYHLFERAITKAKRQNTLIAILFFDLDGFKKINDTLGHEAGDKLLLYFTEELKRSLGESDVAARLGGDEFIVMMEDLTEGTQASSFAERFLEKLKVPAKIGDHNIQIRSSIGISIYPQDGNNIQVLLKQADKALYRVKNSGKNYYQFFTPDLNHKMFKEVNEDKELKNALENNELSVYYQPIYSASQELTHFEALLRWEHPERGLLEAANFIGVAERTELIIPISEWVLTTVCQQIKTLQDKNFHMVPFAVNISGLQLKKQKLSLIIDRLIKENNINPAYLELEFTESIPIENNASIIDDIKALKQLGIKLILDDFGTYYSSFSYLRHFYFDQVKIDGSFIKDILNSKKDKAILQAIIVMAHALDLQVVVEGIETEGQYDYLKTQHIDHFQGYYLGKPMHLEECISLLQRSS